MRPVEGRQALTMQLSLSLLRYDEGLGMLAAQSDRDGQWWEDVDPTERHLIDRALSMWDLAAWYVASGRVDRRTVIEVFRWQIVDLWERAYPYIQHRRAEQPTLWLSLTDLYLDAYAAAPQPAPGRGPDRGAAQPPPPPQVAVKTKTAVPSPAAVDVPPVVAAPPPAPEPEPQVVPEPEPQVVSQPDPPVAQAPEPEAAPAPPPPPPARPTDPWLEALQEAVRTPKVPARYLEASLSRGWTPPTPSPATPSPPAASPPVPTARQQFARPEVPLDLIDIEVDVELGDFPQARAQV
jgi:hypothetical protein